MEVLIVAVDEVESQPESRASQQPPTHLLLDFLPTWPIPLESAYLNSRALVKPGYYYTRVENTYRDPRDRYCNQRGPPFPPPSPPSLSLSLSLSRSLARSFSLGS